MRVEGDLSATETNWRPADPAKAALLDNFWTHMVGIYGTRWSSDYGDVPQGPAARSWLAVLWDLSSRQLKLGLRQCLESPDRWPPGPGAFKRIAIDADRPEYRALGRDRRLGVQPAEDDVRDQHLTALKALVGMAPREGEGGV